MVAAFNTESDVALDEKTHSSKVEKVLNRLQRFLQDKMSGVIAAASRDPLAYSTRDDKFYIGANNFVQTSSFYFVVLNNVNVIEVR